MGIASEIKLDIGTYADAFRRDLSNRSAYELRLLLRGCGLLVARICGAHFEVGADGYKKLFNELMGVLEEFKEIANKGVKSFDCEIIYKGAKSREFTYSCTLEECTEQECDRSLKNKKYYNLDNGREIRNPIFISLSIKEKLFNNN